MIDYRQRKLRQIRFDMSTPKEASDFRKAIARSTKYRTMSQFLREKCRELVDSLKNKR